jgi:hypothetical protein
VGKLRRKFGCDAKGVLAKRRIGRRPVTETYGKADTPIIKAAWFEYKCSGAWARPGTEPGMWWPAQYGRCTMALEADPPRWFIIRELGFGVRDPNEANDRSLSETLRRLDAADVAARRRKSSAVVYREAA